MSENKFLRIVVLLLLLLNAGTLGFLLLHHAPGYSAPAGEDHPPRGGAAGYLRRELALTDEQERHYKALRDSHHDQVEQIRRQMGQQQRRLYALLSNRDTAAISRLSRPVIDSLGAAQRTIVHITFAHFRQVRALCTPAQQQRFDAVILEALNKLR